MAQTKLTDFAAALSLLFRNQLTTQINSVAVLPYLLPKMPGEGKAVFETAEFSGASDAVASAEGVARDSSDADDEAEVPINLNWAQYDKTVSVTGLAQAASGSNFNPESIGSRGQDLLLGRAMRQTRRVALGIARDSYAGDETTTPIELAGAARAIDSSGIFESIDPSTFPEWAAAENTDSLTGVSLSIIRKKLFTPIYDASGELPEFCTCPSNVFDILRDLFNDNQFRNVERIEVIRGGGPRGLDPRTIKLSAGMDAFLIDNIPFVRDRQATANTIYGWNTNYVEFQQLDPLASMLQRFGGSALEMMRQITDNPHMTLPREMLEGMEARTNGLSPHFRVLGDRGDSTELMVIVYAQLVWRRRNTFGKLILS